MACAVDAGMSKIIGQQKKTNIMYEGRNIVGRTDGRENNIDVMP